MPNAELPRELGLLDSISIIIGIVIGASIFLVPNLIAQSLDSSGWILGVWIFTGVLSFFGALAFAELGAMLPATGGQYVYLREAWGRLPAFLCGWTHFLVSQTAGIAYLSVTFALFFAYFVPLSPWQQKGLALSVMASLTMVNYRGVRLGRGRAKLLQSCEADRTRRDRRGGILRATRARAACFRCDYGRSIRGGHDRLSASL